MSLPHAMQWTMLTIPVVVSTDTNTKDNTSWLYSCFISLFSLVVLQSANPRYGRDIVLGLGFDLYKSLITKFVCLVLALATETLFTSPRETKISIMESYCNKPMLST